MQKVAYKGISGSHSHQAAVKYFGLRDIEYIGIPDTEDMMASLVTGKSDYVVAPIENSMVGSIYETYDTFIQKNCYMKGEIYLPINHCLLVLPHMESAEQLKSVVSHPKALEQCSHFLKRHSSLVCVPTYDTATGAAMVAEGEDGTQGAIAGAYAAEVYGLKVLEQHIENNSQATTRFAILGKEFVSDGSVDKCSLVLTLQHRPGSLYDVLKLIADENLNMTMLESRPIPEKAFEYSFYIDIDFSGRNSDSLKNIIEEIRENTISLQVLGYYKGGVIESAD